MRPLLLEAEVHLVDLRPAEVWIHGDQRRRLYNKLRVLMVVDEGEGRMANTARDTVCVAVTEILGVGGVRVGDMDDVVEGRTTREWFAIGRKDEEVTTHRSIEDTGRSVNHGVVIRIGRPGKANAR